MNQETSKITREDIRRVKAAVRDQLLKIPGVVGLDIGYKTVGGEKTDQLALIIYVQEKKDVPEDEALPETINEVPTDVVQRRFVLHKEG